jgi:predicted dehydrogenase
VWVGWCAPPTTRAAVHGAGWLSTQHAKAYMNNPHTRIAAISSRKQESAKKLKDMYSLEEIKTHTN